MSAVALIDRCNVCQKELEINLTGLDWKLIEAAIGEKHTCPNCKLYKPRLSARPVIHDAEHRPTCELRLVLRVMNKIMGKD